MTLYSWRCFDCQCYWDDWAEMHGAKASACPECGGDGVRRFTSFASPASLGHSIWPQRTPTHLLKPRRDDEDRDIWQAKKDAGQTMHPAAKG